MRLSIAAALLLSPLAASATEPPGEAVLRSPEARLPATAKICEDDLTRQTRGSKGKGAMKLGELPPAEAFRAVHREVGGCLEPLLVREYRADEARPETRKPARPEQPF